MSTEIVEAPWGGVPKAAPHIHGLVVTVEDVEGPAGTGGLPLQPLQEVQHPNLIISSVQLVPHLTTRSSPPLPFSPVLELPHLGSCLSPRTPPPSQRCACALANTLTMHMRGHSHSPPP